LHLIYSMIDLEMEITLFTKFSITKSVDPKLANVSYHAHAGGHRFVVDLPNGYSASIIQNPYSYGGEEGLWEIGVMKDGSLDYSTPITSDVLGYIPANEVMEIVGRIAKL